METGRDPAGSGASARPLHPVLAGSPLLIAHRGGAGLRPENTMAAFVSANDHWNADMFEFDVRATADGRCVVIHDPTVDRTTDGTGAVASMTYAESRRFDAGYRFTPDGGRTYPFRGTGITIPLIEDVFAAFPNMRFTIEVKARAAQIPLFDAIDKFACADRVIAAGMYNADRDLFHRHAGALSASTEQMRAWIYRHLVGLGRWAKLRADVVQVPERAEGRRIVTPRFIRALHARGILVHVWTVNDERDMRRLLEWGVDGLVSDRPDVLAHVLHEVVNRPLPPGVATANDV
jgi:glycerophosphoryl diester phosphodiesterase